jgi:hypothetical protein
MDTYLISTNQGWIKTNDDKMAQMPFTIDEMIADHSVLGEGHKIFFVTKNNKDYWEFGKYVDA